MSMEHLQKLMDEGKKISFYLSPSPHHSKYVCDIEDRRDEEHLVFADTVQGLIQKLERKEFSGDRISVDPEDLKSVDLKNIL